MIIAQITDAHIGGGGKTAKESNVARLSQVCEEIKKLSTKPDVLIVTGDLSEHGDLSEYQTLKQQFDEFSFPTYLAVGNHDTRDTFSAVFPEMSGNGGFIQYAIDTFPLRIIVLDTLNPGYHGGTFCQDRADWLTQELAKDPDRPTLIALHHPPIATGIDWLTNSPDADWIIRLKKCLSSHKNIVRIIAGHIHRTIYSEFAGAPLSVLDAVGPQVALNLEDIDANKPDNRPLLVEGRPAFALHQWSGHSLTTHIQHVPNDDIIARYDTDHAYVVKMTKDMRA